MAWTWAGFWMDDPVFRSRCLDADFFQSGRHKAEERFWRNYIHQSGGYKWKIRDEKNKEENEKESEDKVENDNKKIGDEDTNIQDEEDLKKIKILEDKKREVEDLWNDLRAKGWKRKEQARNLKTSNIWERDTDDMCSNYVCSVCSTHGDDVQKKL